jgi:ATP-binding cassette subfamily F protein uup
VDKLSGGEKGRLLLARLFLREGNLLILDEPTNDLDFETLSVLEELIETFPGAVLVVSHDRAFLENTCTEFFAFHPNPMGRAYSVIRYASLEQ